jgi:hypothetical protein
MRRFVLMAKDTDDAPSTAGEPMTPHMPSPGEEEAVAATEDAEKEDAKE